MVCGGRVLNQSRFKNKLPKHIHRNPTTSHLELEPQQDFGITSYLLQDPRAKGIIFSWLGSPNVALQADNEKQCKICNGSSSQGEPLDPAWTSLATPLVIVFKLREYFKLIAMVQVTSSIEDKKCFSNLNFIKFKLQNWLTTYLFVVKMFTQ